LSASGLRTTAVFASAVPGTTPTAWSSRSLTTFRWAQNVRIAKGTPVPVAPLAGAGGVPEAGNRSSYSALICRLNGPLTPVIT
jgi:hypothetical protein